MLQPVIVFDLDGTLLDTAPGIMASLNHVIAREGLEPVDYKDVTFLVGQGARATIERAYALRNAELDPERMPELLDIFIAHYLEEMPGECTPFPGVIEALGRLKDEGFKLAVCTNKLETLARPLLDLMNMTSWFDAITGGDTFSVKKPDPGHLLGTIAAAGGTFPHAVMIGDSINDIKAAANAHIPSIGVPFGYTDLPIETFSPTHVIQHFDELTVDLVRQLLTPKG
ncbi:HAD family hydrolase [Rhizobium sp. L1K21]|uniref:HAD family hydrolase n=1 Tax=Rhizobium sp. L1K21 TaxID=2954933 RepID=UPI002093750D|nr:HAD family hydrolase [Rhizobium sp. L1K21]MCO6186331.1 phosphoglycolate phosphatase [Rhizobium sp. L1K21]